MFKAEPTRNGCNIDNIEEKKKKKKERKRKRKEKEEEEGRRIAHL